MGPASNYVLPRTDTATSTNAAAGSETAGQRVVFCVSDGKGGFQVINNVFALFF